MIGEIVDGQRKMILKGENSDLTPYVKGCLLLRDNGYRIEDANSMYMRYSKNEFAKRQITFLKELNTGGDVIKLFNDIDDDFYKGVKKWVKDEKKLGCRRIEEYINLRG